MEPEYTTYLSENENEQLLRTNVDFADKNGTPDTFLDLYSSQHNLAETINENFINLGNNIKLETELTSMDLNIFNTLEYNNTNGNSLNGIEELNYEKSFSLEGHALTDNYGNITPLGNFSESKATAINKNNKLTFKENNSIQHNMDHYKKKEIAFLKANEEKYIYNTHGEMMLDPIGEPWCSSKRKEALLSQCDISCSIEDGYKTTTAESRESHSLPLSAKNDINHNECPLTCDFFDTIENINTKVYEKYNNLKVCSENLIEHVNQSDFDKRIGDLLKMHDDNSDFISQFKNKSEKCIRRCQKFETTSENLIGECINTLADCSMCYAKWVGLHSCKIDSIHKSLDDIKLFIEENK